MRKSSVVAGKERPPPHLRTGGTLACFVTAALLSGGASPAHADVLYVGDIGNGSVQRFDPTTGAYLGALVPPGGVLNSPTGLIFGRDGNLIVVDQNVGLPINSDIRRFDGRTGAYLGALVPNSAPGAPFAGRGLVLGPGNTLFVADLGDLGVSPRLFPGRIARFNATTGAFLGDLTPTGFAGEFNPRGLVIGPDGKLYAASRNTGLLGGGIFRFDPTTGAYLGEFIASDATNDLNRPEGLVFGPDGNLYVASFRADSSDNDKILEFNGATGAFLGSIPLDQVGGARAFAQALLFGPGGALFVPITNTGEVRRYDVNTKAFDILVPASTSPLATPVYLTFGSTNPGTLAFTAEAVPEPSSLALLALGGAALAGWRKLRRRTATA